MSFTFIDLMLSSVVTQPEHGKWTKFMPPTEWITDMLLNNEMLEKLLKRAQQKFSMVTDTGVEFSWHALAGSRFQLARESAGQEEFRVSICCLCILMETVKSITCWFLKVCCDWGITNLIPRLPHQILM